jgi:hypothetical protein
MRAEALTILSNSGIGSLPKARQARIAAPRNQGRQNRCQRWFKKSVARQDDLIRNASRRRFQDFDVMRKIEDNAFEDRAP